MNFSFPTVTLDFYISASPVLILCLGAICAMLQSVFKKVGSETAVFGFQIVILVGALLAALLAPNSVETAYLSGNYLTGLITQFGQVCLLVIAVIVSIIFKDTWLKAKFFRGDLPQMI